jgi:hypothetical protein
MHAQRENRPLGRDFRVKWPCLDDIPGLGVPLILN